MMSTNMRWWTHKKISINSESLNGQLFSGIIVAMKGLIGQQ